MSLKNTSLPNLPSTLINNRINSLVVILLIIFWEWLAKFRPNLLILPQILAISSLDQTKRERCQLPIPMGINSKEIWSMALKMGSGV